MITLVCKISRRFSNIKNFWADAAAKHLADVTSSCSACKGLSKPEQSRKFFLASVNRQFSDIGSVDHFFLGKK